MFSQPLVIVTASDSATSRYDDVLCHFSAQRVCAGGVEAMQSIEAAPANVLIIETAIDDMPAHELAAMVREIDSELDRFTYIILLGDAITPEIDSAFEHHVDAFVESRDRDDLRRVATTGARLALRLNELIGANALLERERQVLVKNQLVDPTTGLGNRRFAEQALTDSIAQIESRGGAVCLLLVSLENHGDIIEKWDQRIADELLVAIGNRLRALVRPMDIVTRFDEKVFALVLVQPSIEHCTAECYQRIFDGVRLKSYPTSAGYLELVIAMSICASHAEQGAPQPARMIETAERGLSDSARDQKIAVAWLSEA